MLLSPALGGDCKTTVIVCASMEQDDAVETVQVISFFKCLEYVLAHDGSKHTNKKV